MIGHWSQSPKPTLPWIRMHDFLVYQWIKSAHFLDGYASNISKLMNLEDDRLYGIKSHDCHVFIQTLIPLAYYDYCKKQIWDTLTKINHFFRDIWSNKMHIQHMKKLEMNIVQTTCKFEIILSSSFFNLIEHLHIDLLFEAKLKALSSIDECIHSRG